MHYEQYYGKEEDETNDDDDDDKKEAKSKVPIVNVYSRQFIFFVLHELKTYSIP